MFRVRLHGHGIVLPVEGSVPILGFYTTRFVSATSRAQAIEVAIGHARDHFEGFFPSAKGKLELDVIEALRVMGRFRLRSGCGYTFYAGKGG
jgi:hypothetical protein